MADFITVTDNLPEFQRALREYVSEVKNKTLPEILNKRGRNIASKAPGLTPKATIEHIDEALANRHLFRLTNWRRAKKGLPAVGGQAMSEPARKEKARRHSSRAYIASGWIPAIIKFGGHPKRQKTTVENSAINKAKNQVATADELVAILENTANGAGKVGADALRRAIEIDTADMEQHVRSLQEVAHKYSAR